MNILAVDSSTKNLSLAVKRDHGALRYGNVTLGPRLSSSIIPAIQRILKKVELEVDDIDGFAVGLGPGSFTGLRVGLATIKGLAFAANKPVAGIASLDAVAMNVKDDGPVCVICDARRDLVYTAFYVKEQQQLRRQGDYLLTDIHSVLKKIKVATTIIGDGIKIFKTEIDQAKQRPLMTLTREKLWAPQARNLLLFAEKKLRQGDLSDIDTMAPLYLYPEDCQVRRRHE